ncbi:MAG: hypothetical protein EA403_10800 [Spirochaetaceae bacterium]|nr:MAG: hypothetical protein EA403_10800 [Spirochaetaceae bacterium]
MEIKPRVCVLGGGFAGIQATRAILRRLPDAELTLIDRNPYATMIPALPDALSGRITRNAMKRPLSGLFPADRVRLVTDRIDRIDLSARTLQGRSGQYAYDALLIAVGSVPEYYGFSPESGTLYTAHSFPAVEALRAAVAQRHRAGPEAPVVIVGGGYTGIEVAACLRHGVQATGQSDSNHPPITIVEAGERLLPFLTNGERERIGTYLHELGVDVRTGTTLTAFRDGIATLSDGTTIPNALVCWSAGMRAAVPELDPQPEQTRDGRLEVNDFLQLPGFPDVFVGGDAAALRKNGTVVRRAVNFAFYSGRRAGHNLALFLRNRPMRAFSPVDLGWVIPMGGISVGRLFGALRVGGRFGLRLHYSMCGFRHFPGAATGEFYRTALRLKRVPDPISANPPGDQP